MYCVKEMILVNIRVSNMWQGTVEVYLIKLVKISATTENSRNVRQIFTAVKIFNRILQQEETLKKAVNKLSSFMGIFWCITIFLSWFPIK